MNYVYTSVENNVAVIEFSSEQANALSMDLLHRLAKELDVASVNDSVKVVLLKISNYYFQEYSIGEFLYFKSNILDITYIIIYFL